MSLQADGKGDLHGSAPDNHDTALLLIDVINDFEFPRGHELFRRALPIAPNIAKLKERARSAGVPVVYVNDNFGRWRSNFQQIVAHCLSAKVRGRPFVEQLTPDEQDYFVLKPKHSGFYQSPLELLLKSFGTKRLILTGLSTNSCVLFTAADAYMRGVQLLVSPDCVAACSDQEHDCAMEQMRCMLNADVSESARVDIESLAKQAEG